MNKPPHLYGDHNRDPNIKALGSTLGLRTHVRPHTIGTGFSRVLFALNFVILWAVVFRAWGLLFLGGFKAWTF